MKSRLNACLIALENRFSESQFQQAICDWQEAHPVADAMLGKAPYIAMWVLCILLCTVMALFTIVLTFSAKQGVPIGVMDVAFVAVFLVGFTLGIRALRNW